MKLFNALLISATLLAVPATAQTMTVLLPDLDFPTDQVTTSTKGCTPATGATVCPLPQE